MSCRLMRGAPHARGGLAGWAVPPAARQRRTCSGLPCAEQQCVGLRKASQSHLHLTPVSVTGSLLELLRGLRTGRRGRARPPGLGDAPEGMDIPAGGQGVLSRGPLGPARTQHPLFRGGETEAQERGREAKGAQQVRGQQDPTDLGCRSLRSSREGAPLQMKASWLGVNREASHVPSTPRRVGGLWRLWDSCNLSTEFQFVAIKGKRLLFEAESCCSDVRTWAGVADAVLASGSCGAVCKAEKLAVLLK